MKISEHFLSMQGEGHLVGVPMVFARLSGCNLACDFCDTDYNHGAEMTPADFAEELVRCYADFHPTYLCWTGGEPTLQLKAMWDVGRALLPTSLKHIRHVLETNGSIAFGDSAPFLCQFEHITISPKDFRSDFEIENFRAILALGRDVTVKPLFKSLSTFFRWTTRIELLATFEGAKDHLHITFQPYYGEESAIADILKSQAAMTWFSRANKMVKEVRLLPQLQKMLSLI